MHERLDKFVVLKGLYPSRTKAQEGIENSEVSVNGIIETRVKIRVSEDDTILKLVADEVYVSRGAYKLLGAIDAFNIDINNKDCLDIGASSGGFSQVLLERNAKEVVAIDVGHDQLVEIIRNNPKVKVMEKYNFRNAIPSWFEHKFDFICSDVSFISLKHIIPPLISLVNDDCEGVLLIKPQFEAGPENINKHGIVKNTAIHIKVIYDIISCVNTYNFGVRGLCLSQVRGKDGNQEYLLYIKYQASNIELDIEALINKGAKTC